MKNNKSKLLSKTPMFKKLNKRFKPYYRTKMGQAHLGDAIELLKLIPENSINLIITSPPFALTSKKEYGNEEEDKYVDWFMNFAKEFYRVLKQDGSFVVDLGGTYLPGHPVRSLYQHGLLIRMVRGLNYFFAQELFHYNPIRFAKNFAEFFINFITGEGDPIYDPIGGSSTTYLMTT